MRYTLLLFLCAASLLVGCGQYGPLYLPQKTTDTSSKGKPS